MGWDNSATHLTVSSLGGDNVYQSSRLEDIRNTSYSGYKLPGIWPLWSLTVLGHFDICDEWCLSPFYSFAICSTFISHFMQSLLVFLAVQGFRIFRSKRQIPKFFLISYTIPIQLPRNKIISVLRNSLIFNESYVLQAIFLIFKNVVFVWCILLFISGTHLLSALTSGLNNRFKDYWFQMWVRFRQKGQCTSGRIRGGNRRCDRWFVSGTINIYTWPHLLRKTQHLPRVQWSRFKPIIKVVRFSEQWYYGVFFIMSSVNSLVTQKVIVV